MHKRGFTLIELLAVILIVGILTSVAVPQYRRSLERSRIAESYQVLTAIYDSVLRFRAEKALTGIEDPTFPMLDVSLKGQLIDSSDGQQWKTDYFTYHLEHGTYGTGVWAELGTGPHQGLQVYYNGSEFLCCDIPLHPGAIGEVCEFFNIPITSTCTNGAVG